MKLARSFNNYSPIRKWRYTLYGIYRLLYATLCAAENRNLFEVLNQCDESRAFNREIDDAITNFKLQCNIHLDHLVEVKRIYTPYLLEVERTMQGERERSHEIIRILLGIMNELAGDPDTFAEEKLV
jgi:hypothetical protein